MPIYEYKCEKCNKIFEEFQSINDPAITECVFCKSPVKRVFSPVGISFKGSVFYANDHAKKSVQPEAAKSSPSAITETAAK